ncbi:putative MARVEL domain-containing protein [Seiridium cardinale]|uniref:MARVEL domain-containing protein n=1 Tax=Seiridium cardinale TaxID=138064 RepID=A0ABR2Y7R5_9PEZI
MSKANLFYIILRLAEWISAAIIAGLAGSYLYILRNDDYVDWSRGRLIYTAVLASISFFLALIWLFPFSRRFIHWPFDLVLSILWFIAFGLLFRFFNGFCGRNFYWGNTVVYFDCGRWRAIMAFSLFSALCWLASGIIGIFWVRDHESRQYRRRTWSSSRV